MSDPFDDLDEYEDREGDPFAHLDDAAPGVPEDDAEGAGTDDHDSNSLDADPKPTVDEVVGAGGRSDREDAGNRDADAAPVDEAEQVDVAGDPFSDIDVSRGDPFESAESPFQHVDVDAVDANEVWARFTGEVDTDESVEARDDDVVTVSKHAFCEGCPHFTAPPDVECTNDGTDILEFVGPDEVRVSNCPIVQERRELGEVHE